MAFIFFPSKIPTSLCDAGQQDNCRKLEKKGRKIKQGREESKKEEEEEVERERQFSKVTILFQINQYFNYINNAFY